jgi:hypothetical protein
VVRGASLGCSDAPRTAELNGRTIFLDVDPRGTCAVRSASPK